MSLSGCSSDFFAREGSKEKQNILLVSSSSFVLPKYTVSSNEFNHLTQVGRTCTVEKNRGFFYFFLSKER